MLIREGSQAEVILIFVFLEGEENWGWENCFYINAEIWKVVVEREAGNRTGHERGWQGVRGHACATTDPARH